MRRLIPLIGLLALVTVWLVPAPPVHAQADRTWVSRAGDDANPCSTTMPCRTFAGAIARTAVHGEINCLDAGGFGTVAIIKSITIDCHDVFAGIQSKETNGITIVFDSFPESDTRRTVRLRNLNISGLGTGLTGINILGVTKAENSAVYIEDCLVDGMYGGAMRGIADTRNAGELTIVNTTVRNIGGFAILISPKDGNHRLDATLDRVRVQNADSGIRITAPVRALIGHSLLSGNAKVGIHAAVGVELHVSDSTVSKNDTGVQSDGATVRLSNNEITLNRTAITGATTSFGNNRISGNPIPGTAPTPAGPVSNALGQQ
jgi:Right handed beta helix region